MWNCPVNYIVTNMATTLRYLVTEKVWERWKSQQLNIIPYSQLQLCEKLAEQANIWDELYEVSVMVLAYIKRDVTCATAECASMMWHYEVTKHCDFKFVRI